MFASVDVNRMSDDVLTLDIYPVSGLFAHHILLFRSTIFGIKTSYWHDRSRSSDDMWRQLRRNEKKRAQRVNFELHINVWIEMACSLEEQSEKEREKFIGTYMRIDSYRWVSRMLNAAGTSCGFQHEHRTHHDHDTYDILHGNHDNNEYIHLYIFMYTTIIYTWHRFLLLDQAVREQYRYIPFCCNSRREGRNNNGESHNHDHHESMSRNSNKIIFIRQIWEFFIIFHLVNNNFPWGAILFVYERKFPFVCQLWHDSKQICFRFCAKCLIKNSHQCECHRK